MSWEFLIFKEHIFRSLCNFIISFLKKIDDKIMKLFRVKLISESIRLCQYLFFLLHDTDKTQWFLPPIPWVTTWWWLGLPLWLFSGNMSTTATPAVFLVSISTQVNSDVTAILQLLIVCLECSDTSLLFVWVRVHVTLVPCALELHLRVQTIQERRYRLIKISQILANRWIVSCTDTCCTRSTSKHRAYVAC